jgi:maleate cis-trans isomerase
VTAHRIGLVVPSSNITVETEIPALLARHAGARFSFHSSRMRMHTVSPEQLRAMNAQRERCVDELADARVGPAEEEFGLPVLSAATAGAYALLQRLGLPAILPGAGRLLAAGPPVRGGRQSTAGAPALALQSRS